MATKKEIAKEKAIKGGMPSDVADNIFRMQMGNHGNQNTKGSFSVKNQKTMAMSTMFQTPDPEGETALSIQQDEFEVPKYMGSENFQKAFGTARKAGLETFEFPKGSGKMFTTKLGPATETHYLETPETTTFTSAFDQGFDSAFKPNIPEVNLEKFTFKKKGDKKPGMVDTFSALDTRQAGRKAMVETRRLKQAAKREARAEMKAGDITRKKFKEKKKQAKLKAAKARREAMERILAQGQAQRAAGKNPAITKEFDPSAEAPFLMKPMQFRKKYKK